MDSEIKQRSFRDLLWDYPEILYGYYQTTRPLGAVFISIMLGILLFVQLSQPYVFNIVGNEDNTRWSEGVIGTVQVLNPIFINQNQVDRDIFELVYEKLLYIDHDGDPLPGIAKSWDISEDGLVYTFTLAQDRVWHDGERLDAHDVAFTFQKAIEISNKAGGDTIGSALNEVIVTVVDQYTVSFTLPDRSATFLESVASYIIPMHILETTPNVEFSGYGLDTPPIGSGPFRIASMNSKVIILNASNVTSYSPKVRQITYYMFDDPYSLEVAFRNGVLDGASGLQGRELTFLNDYENFRIYSTLLEHRKKLIFMNMADPTLAEVNVRKALSHGVNKLEVMEEAVIDGEITYSPIPSNSWALNPEIDFYKLDLEEADRLLAEISYTKGEDGYYRDGEGKKVELSLTYLNSNANRLLAESLIKDWDQLGITVLLNPVEYNSLINEVLATRNYQLMLFELETTIDPDQYNLWHSLKTNYPDLNISGFSYNRVDLILERARVNTNKSERTDDYKLFQRYLMQDPPVIFLYEPVYNYVVTSRLQDFTIERINYPSERFINIETWELK